MSVVSQQSNQPLKTREELIEMFRNEEIELIAMIIECEGYEEALEYHHEMENPPQRLHFKLPEYCKYHLTLKFVIRSRPLENLTYHQVVKKGGIPFKSRKEKLADVADINNENNPHHTVKLSPDDIPGGMFIRGVYPASSTFYANGKEVFETDWTIEVVKKGTAPLMGR